MGEKARDVKRHWIRCFATMGVPKTIKTDNGPAYVSRTISFFLQDWGIQHVTGIPHSPTGQAIVESVHGTVKAMLNKKKGGILWAVLPHRNSQTKHYIYLIF